MSLVLVDMDGVLADFEAHLWERVRALAPKHPQLFAVRDSYNLLTGVKRFDKIVAEVMDEPDFYERLNPIPGAFRALDELEDEGHNVAICSTPWLSNPTCASQKLAWIDYHSNGKRRSAVTTLAQDKTLVRGDFLIDDKPYITGLMTPTWEHVMFTQAYNIAVPSKHRLTNWSNWRSEMPFLSTKKIEVNV